MAARAGGPEFGEVSRFSVLATRDSESSEEGAVEHADIDVKKKTRNAKKRARKKKKVAADSAATAELRKMAFGGSSKQNKNQSSTPAFMPSVSGATFDKKSRPLASEHSDWIERDEQFVVHQFQEDLEEALRLSLEETKSQRPVPIENRIEEGAVKRSKDHSVTLPLDTFQKHPLGFKSVNGMTKGGSKDLDKLDHISENIVTESTSKRVTKKKSKNRVVKEDVYKVNGINEALKTRKDTQNVNDKPSVDETTLHYWRDKLEDKEKENETLQKMILKSKEELAEVKKRNKQLCFILGQGEMREKAEILQQVEALTNVKDELSSEILELHSQLEQERSKVSALKIELAKYQNGKSKKHSTSENEHR